MQRTGVSCCRAWPHYSNNRPMCLPIPWSSIHMHALQAQSSAERDGFVCVPSKRHLRFCFCFCGSVSAKWMSPRDSPI